MPAHEDLPDPEAWWRLAGDEDARPSGQKRSTRRYDAIVAAIVVVILAGLAIDVVGSDPLYDAAAWLVEFMNALAGPAASAAGLVVAVMAVAALPSHGIAHGLARAAVLASTFGVLNLIPITFQERRGGPNVQTDGRLALDAARVLRALR